MFIEFVGVTFVNELLQVSRVHFCNTSSVYCVVFVTPSQVSSPSPLIPLYSLPPPRTPLSSGNHLTVVFEYFFSFLLNPFTFSTQPPTPLHS